MAWKFGPSSKHDGKSVVIMHGGKQYEFKPASYGRYHGHIHYGRLWPDVAQVAEIFAGLGLPQLEAAIFAAVFSFEGGFDTIQTYSRAKFEWGVIQFAGIGGLPGLLRNIKCMRPDLFLDYFGILDVDDEGITVYWKGIAYRKGSALNLLHDEPTLWKPFLLASQDPAIQTIQVQTAYENYYTRIMQCTVEINGTAFALGALFANNEYGRAVLFDRAIHRGVGSAARMFRRAAKRSGVRSPKEARKILETARGLDRRYQFRWDNLRDTFETTPEES